MSCTEIYTFDKEGYACWYGEVKNAWRGAMSIWGALEEKYLPPYIPKYVLRLGITTHEQAINELGYKPMRVTSWMDESAMQEIWNLADSDKVSEVDKICLHTTFDKVLIRKEDIPKVVDAFKNFEAETSLKEQADILEEIYKSDDYIAVGWCQTSANSKSWGDYHGYDDEKDESIPYNCLNEIEHYWLFDELK